MSETVSLVKSTHSYQGVLNSLEPFKEEIKAKLAVAKSPVIKVNFVRSDNPLAATPVDAVKATLEFIKPYYSGQIKIVEQASLGTTEEGFEKNGYLPLEQEYNCKLVNLKDDETYPLTILNNNDEEVEIPISKTLKDSDFIISVCRAKTHNAVVVTLTLKNLLVGCIVGGLSVRQQVHGKNINQNLFKIAEFIKPDLAILDGTVGMQGEGPGQGHEIFAGWVAAGFDALAVDSLGTELMGFDLKDVGYLTLMKEADLGQAFPDIEVIGEDHKPLKLNFEPHPTFEQQRLWR